MKCLSKCHTNYCYTRQEIYVSKRRLPPFETILLPFVEQIGLRTAQIDNLRTSVTILLLYRTLFTIVGIGNTRATADHAPALQV